MRRLLFAALVVGGCTPATPWLSLEITPGHETDAFSREPAITTMTIRALNSGQAVIAATESAPGGTFSLGEFSPDEFVSLEVEGRDATNDVRVRGRSMGVTLGDVGGTFFPVFAQRVNEFARPPLALTEAHTGGVAASVGERFLLLTGGTGDDPSRASYYDLFSFGPAAGGVLPRVAETLVVVGSGTTLLVIGKPSDGGAVGGSWVDFAAGTVTDAELPNGLDSFASVAGGGVVRSASGESYVVGGTRTSSASDRVLVVGQDGSLKAVRLTSPRLGAAAAWVDGVGLVVVGGSISAPGLETLSAGASAFFARAYVEDPVVGAAAVASGNPGELLLIGGLLDGKAAATRSLSPGCATACTSTTIDANGLAAALTHCQGYLAGPGLLLAVCEDAASHETAVRRITLAPSAVYDVPLREPRSGATALSTPLGSLAVLGGTRISDGQPALTVESWTAP